MASRNQPAVCASMYPPTAVGFEALVVEANRVAADGYELVSVVRLDKGLAAFFRLKAAPQSSSAPLGSFFGEE